VYAYRTGMAFFRPHIGGIRTSVYRYAYSYIGLPEGAIPASSACIALPIASAMLRAAAAAPLWNDRSGPYGSVFARSSFLRASRSAVSSSMSK
jgi:hypothetical protein